MKAFPQDITLESLTLRHIGVESELGIKGSNVRRDMAVVEQKLQKRGLLQSIGYDGGGREFRTHPISVKSLLKQVRGKKYLLEYYEVLRETTTVLESGGTHIHISILNSDHENMESNATAMAIAFYTQFQKIAGRKSSWAYKMECRTLEEVRERLNGRKGGYYDCDCCCADCCDCDDDSYEKTRQYNLKGSMLNPTYHQTLEFRGGKGSNNCQEILAWVDFLNNVVKFSNRESIEGVQFKQLLKGKHIEAYAANLKGWRKLGKRQLEQKFNGSNLC